MSRGRGYAAYLIWLEQGRKLFPPRSKKILQNFLKNLLTNRHFCGIIITSRGEGTVQVSSKMVRDFENRQKFLKNFSKTP